MTSLVYKGKRKLRKDKNLIRPNFTILNKEDLNNVFDNKQQLIEEFKKAGIFVSKKTIKNRLFLNYKNKIIKIDFENGKIIMEIDKKIFRNKTAKQQIVNNKIAKQNNMEM